MWYLWIINWSNKNVHKLKDGGIIKSPIHTWIGIFTSYNRPEQDTVADKDKEMDTI